MSEPLNPSLYSALVSAFGEVRLANQGLRFSGEVVSSAEPSSGSRHGYRRLHKRSAGEYYRVCCPKCSDRRFRLWINHRWGTELSGMRLDHLAKCYNENCEQEPGFTAWLRKAVEGHYGKVIYVDMEQKPNEIRPISLPGACTWLHKLPEYHPAVQYLLSRRYDPTELGLRYHVGWCEGSMILPTENKLLFPVYDYFDGALSIMGWQARYLDVATMNDKPPTGHPKYFNQKGNPLHQFLYNGYRVAKQSRIVVICEGALDAIRVGREYGVALFGKTASETQRRMLWEHWGSKGAQGVIALDNDAGKEKQELANWMRSWAIPPIVLEFPTGTDAGKMSTEALWQMITERSSP